jgi:hypothetical protein
MPGGTRTDAAATLLSQLEDLVVTYAGIPEAERPAKLAEDADRITGEVARILQAARRKITPAALP